MLWHYRNIKPLQVRNILQINETPTNSSTNIFTVFCRVSRICNGKSTMSYLSRKTLKLTPEWLDVNYFLNYFLCS